MSCTTVKGPGDFQAIVCIRGKRHPLPKCAWCGALAAYLCDAREAPHVRRLCSQPLCEEHAQALRLRQRDHHRCPFHRVELHQLAPSLVCGCAGQLEAAA